MPEISNLQPGEPELRQNRNLIIAGQLAFLPTGVLTTLLGPMLPILTVRWGLNDSQAGTLFPVQFLSQLGGVLLSGVMLAQIGFRAVFLSGLLLMAAGVGTIFVGPAWAGWISVAVYGLGLGLIIPTDNLMIAEISTGSRAAAVSLLNFFWGIGAVLCSLLVAWAYARGLLLAFLSLVALFLVILAVAMRGLPFPGKRQKSDTAISWRQIVATPVTWLFSMVFFLYPGSETCVGGWIGSFVSRMGPHGAAMGPLMPAFFWAALTAGRGAAGIVLHRVSEQRVLQAGYGFGAIGIAVLLRASGLPAVIASAIITGFSFAAVYPIAVARLSHRFGVQARSIGAVMFAIAALGPAALPWLVGVVSQSAGSLRAGLVVPLVATAILFVIHLREW
ncbi:MAG TPA: MFS transporter [Terriglobales bacterium]|nr:MFS transporter [Terriglobales bacterium]